MPCALGDPARPGVGPDGLQRSLPTLAVLGCCDRWGRGWLPPPLAERISSAAACRPDPLVGLSLAQFPCPCSACNGSGEALVPSDRRCWCLPWPSQEGQAAVLPELGRGWLRGKGHEGPEAVPLQEGGALCPAHKDFRLYSSWFFPYSHLDTCSCPTAGNCGCLLATAIKVWGISPGFISAA